METAGAILAVVLGTLAVLGSLWRWVVLPNLREQLLKPVAENHRQLTENRHSNYHPTVLDRLDDIDSRLLDVAGVVDAIGLSQTAILRRVGSHNRWSDEEHRRIWLAIESLVHEEQSHHSGSADREDEQQ